MSAKGREIEVLEGEHAKKQGWLNTEKAPTLLYTHVILKLDKGETATRVKHGNYMFKDHQATCDTEQILFDFPKIYTEMQRLTQLMVECHVKQDHLAWFATYFQEMLVKKIEFADNNKDKVKFFAVPNPKAGRKSKKTRG